MSANDLPPAFPKTDLRFARRMAATAKTDFVAILEERSRFAVRQLDRFRPAPRQLDQAVLTLRRRAADRS